MYIDLWGRGFVNSIMVGASHSFPLLMAKVLRPEILQVGIWDWS